MITEIFLATVIVLLMVLIYLVLRRVRIEPRDVESAISNAWVNHPSQILRNLKWKRLA